MGSDVLVVFPRHLSFIDQDIELLERHFSVSKLEYRSRLHRFRLLREMARTRVGIGWFVLGYAYGMVRLASLFDTRTLLIAAGWDVESLPEFEYGEMRSPKRRSRTSYALANADKVLPVSSFTLAKVLNWAPSARAEVLCHGFDSRRFSPQNRPRAGVVTVARVTHGTWRLKGLSVFVDVARELPDVPFTIVGDTSAAGGLTLNLPENVHLTGFLPQQSLIEVYRGSKVYAQLSAVESFGCALAEAMLCGCVPVITDRGALPETAGPTAYSTPYGDVDKTASVIEHALHSDTGEAAREYVAGKFPLNLRATRLVAEVRALLGGR